MLDPRAERSSVTTVIWFHHDAAPTLYIRLALQKIIDRKVVWHLEQQETHHPYLLLEVLHHPLLLFALLNHRLRHLLLDDAHPLLLFVLQPPHLQKQPTLRLLLLQLQLLLRPLEEV